MAMHPSNDGDGLRTRPSQRPAEPDAHGQAALLLAESLLHQLVERRVLTTAEALETVRTACVVKAEVATAAHESAGRMQQSLALLAGIERSLAWDETG